MAPGCQRCGKSSSIRLARAQAAGEQPVAAANGNRPDLVFDPVVVDRQFVIHESGQRNPAPQAVVQRLGGC